MRKIRKKAIKRTVEAYACYCHDMGRCFNQCYQFDSMQAGIATIADAINNTTA